MGNRRVQLRRDNNILCLDLIAPPANQTDSLFFEELAAIIPALTTARNAHGLIISGKGRHFSSGANIDELKEQMAKKNQRINAELMDRSVRLFNCITELPYPVIAMIQGCCLGSGLELALACHYRISTPNGFFSLPETTFELMPGCGGTFRLPKLVGVGKAINLILSSENLLAEDGLRLGLIDSIVAKKELLPTAIRMINTLHPFHNPCFTVM